MKLVICHRRKDRTLKWSGKYLPVCARCTGLCLGLFVGLILGAFLRFYFNVEFTLHLLAFSILIMLPTIIDGTIQYYKPRESTNFIRLTTGFIGGVGVGILCIYFMNILQIY